MAARPAQPDRYVVDRIGSPDPANSEYYVLDLVHDFDARVVLAKLGSIYRQRGLLQKAEAAFMALHATKDAHAEAIETRNKLSVAKEKKGARQSAR